MIAQPRLFVPSAQPSTTVIKAAQNAAASQHAQINLIRMIKSLDKTDISEEATNATRRRDWETVQYARVLLDTLQESNEGSSNTSSILSDLDRTLKSVEIRYRNISATPTPSGPPPSTVPLPDSPATSPVSPPSEPISVTLSPPEPARNLRKRALNTEAYLRTRLAEDREGDEAGLLPLKLQQARKEENERDTLLAGTRPGMGSAQLLEELGGQLADMSHRLKLNAVHFANSLEDEKSLLDDSTDVLEKNLAGTRVSKKHLSSVSSKGKGTTCMTLGVVLVVMIIFVWTYMLIRFT